MCEEEKKEIERVVSLKVFTLQCIASNYETSILSTPIGAVMALMFPRLAAPLIDQMFHGFRT